MDKYEERIEDRFNKQSSVVCLYIAGLPNAHLKAEFKTGERSSLVTNAHLFQYAANFV